MFGSSVNSRRFPHRNRRAGRVRLQLEALEQRWVPAVLDVTRDAAGTVRITEDPGNPNQQETLEVRQVNSTTYVITGLDSTQSVSGGGGDTTLSVNAPGGSSDFVSGGKTLAGNGNTISTDTDLTISNVQGFNINMGGVADTATEADLVELVGNGTGTAALPGDMVINANPGGAGTAALDVRDAQTAGFDIGGQLVIGVGSNNGALSVALNLTATYGSVLINGSNGGTTLASGSANADQGIAMGGSGTTASEVFGPVALNFKGGANVVGLGDFSGVAGVPTAGLKIDSFLSYVSTASGQNFITLVDVTVASNFAVQASGTDGIVMESGAAATGTTIGGNFTTQDAGNETYQITDTTEITGYVSLNTSGKGNGINFALDKSARIDQYLSLISTGSGSFSATLQGAATVAGNFGFSAGTGSVVLGVADTSGTGPTVGGNLFQVASAVTTESVGIIQSNSATQVAGYVSLNAPGASGAFQVTVDGFSKGAASVPIIGGFLSVISGKGDDSLVIQGGAVVGNNVAWSTGAGSSSVTIQDVGTEVAGNVFETPSNLTTGVTTETFTLTGGAKVDGYVSINSPSAAGAVSVTIDGNNNTDPTLDTVGGYLSVIGGSGSDSVGILNGAVIGNAFAFLLGNGNNVVHTDNARIDGPMFGVFGSGNDQLLLEGPNDNGTTTLGSFLSVVMGAGDDSVQLGRTANSLVFQSAAFNATLDGGPGNNTLNQHLDPVTGKSTSVVYAFPSQLQASNFEHLL